MSKVVRFAASLCALLAAAAVQAAEIRRAEKPVAGSYIVVLKEEAARTEAESASFAPELRDVADELERSFGGRRTHLYRSALRGYATRMTPAQAARLWGMDDASCHHVISALVHVACLRWTAGGMVVRSER